MDKLATSEVPTFTDEMLEEYLQALTEGMMLNDSAVRDRWEVRVHKGQRYLKVMQYSNGRSSSVHAFIEKRTGDLIKAASINAPQRNADGTLAVRYQLANSADRGALCERLRKESVAYAGGYLYLTS